MEIRKFIRKNVEALFLVAAVAGLTGSIVTSAAPLVDHERPVSAGSASLDSGMQVVVIKGKRLSAAEKAALA